MKEVHIAEWLVRLASLDLSERGEIEILLTNPEATVTEIADKLGKNVSTVRIMVGRWRSIVARVDAGEYDALLRGAAGNFLRFLVCEVDPITPVRDWPDDQKRALWRRIWNIAPGNSEAPEEFRIRGIGEFSVDCLRTWSQAFLLPDLPSEDVVKETLKCLRNLK